MKGSPQGVQSGQKYLRAYEDQDDGSGEEQVVYGFWRAVSCPGISAIGSVGDSIR